MKIIILLTALIFLSACNTDPIKVTTEAVKKAPITLPSVDEYNPRTITWIILTPDNQEEVFKNIKKKGSIALFALTANGYKALSLNTGDITKLIVQLQAQIKAQQLYYQK